MPQFQKGAVLVEAMQFTDETKNQCFNFVSCNRYAEFDGNGQPVLRIQTPHGGEVARFGDYIMKDETGFYPVTESAFLQSYIPVN
ncbi:hypothetical protein [Larkinella sp. C7]|uniref:hypothetical protein n=1 Tax=Larkinella sp. C7 TaxID=2576607 RepID=UPI00111107E6|nr:hypothetical protein [Larkinella sp. C7]